MSASRIAPLDALRGLAAVGVAVFHYRLLAGQGARPLQNELGWLYEYGQLAVPLFFVLSGYIFFEAYAQPLNEGRVAGRAFFWLRASRLYPLHLLTLFVAAALQALVLRAGVADFTYKHNDWLHFLLNVGFVQFAWFVPTMSFNLPSWSLTIEAGLYFVFFAFVRRFGVAAAPRIVMAAACLMLSTARGLLPLYGPLNVFFAEGLGCFFVGGCLQLTHDWRDRRKLLLGVAVLALGAALFHLSGGRRETTPALFGGMVMLSLALAPIRRAAQWSALAWLGEISYSIYLWHFPVQAALKIVSATVVPLNFSAPAALALYLALTLAISTLSFRYFEAPAQRMVRRWAFARPLATAPA